MGFYPKAVKDRICLFSARFTPLPVSHFFLLGALSFGTQWAFSCWIWGIQSRWLRRVRTDALVKKEESLWVGASVSFYVLLASIQWKRNVTFHFSFWFSSRADAFRTFTKARP